MRVVGTSHPAQRRFNNPLTTQATGAIPQKNTLSASPGKLSQVLLPPAVQPSPKTQDSIHPVPFPSTAQLLPGIVVAPSVVLLSGQLFSGQRILHIHGANRSRPRDIRPHVRRDRPFEGNRRVLYFQYLDISTRQRQDHHRRSCWRTRLYDVTSLMPTRTRANNRVPLAECRLYIRFCFQLVQSRVLRTGRQGNLQANFREAQKKVETDLNLSQVMQVSLSTELYLVLLVTHRVSSVRSPRAAGMASMSLIRS